MEGVINLIGSWSIPTSNIYNIEKVEENKIKINLVYPAVDGEQIMEYYTLRSLDDSMNDHFFKYITRGCRTSDVILISINDAKYDGYDFEGPVIYDDGYLKIDDFDPIPTSKIGMLYNYNTYLVIFFKRPIIINGTLLTNIKLDCKTLINRDRLHNRIIKAIHTKGRLYH